MTSPADLESHLWKYLKSDRTIMLGLETPLDDHPRPMTALMDSEDSAEKRGPLWIFTARDTSLARTITGNDPAIATFAAKNHDLFATIRGWISLSDDRAVIDRLWNPFVAAWYEEGKDDPKLVLLRFDADRAVIWENGSSLIAGVKAMFGIDPKADYRDKGAEVSMR